MFPGLNPRKLESVMKKMGMNQEEIPSSRVIIEKKDGDKIIIEDASVTKIKMQGQETFQIAGDAREESGEVEISKQDIQTIIDKTGVSEEKARETLEKTKDLAEAILELSE